jgi:hypothetical protein
MRFQSGQKPQWKSKPKVSPLDGDAEFLKLRSKILSGTMKPFEEAGLFVDASDGDRLGTKNPARLVRDYLRRVLKDASLEADFDLTCRQTSEPGVWGVWLTYEPRESAATEERARAARQGGRRRAQ